MNAAAYLDADASALADREHTNTHTNTNTDMRQPPGGGQSQGAKLPASWAPHQLTDSTLLELEYAADLFRRADSALSSEVARLRGLAVQIDLAGVQKACNALVCAAVELRIHALREHERRAS
jgi:hypothetical protein